MSETPSSIPPPPSHLPPPTGNYFHDLVVSVKHVAEIPCARNSLLGGIASGVGIGVVRAMSSKPLVAGNWAMATFTFVSIGSFQFCQKQLADQRERVTKVIESTPRRVVKQDEDTSSNDQNASTS